MPFPIPPPRLLPFPVLARRAWASITAHPKELLIITFAFWAVFAVLDALHYATLALLRARAYSALEIPSALSFRMAVTELPFNALYACGAFALLLGASLSSLLLLRFGGSMQDVSDGLGKRYVSMIKLCMAFALHSFLWVPLLGIVAGKFLFAEYGDLIIAVEMTGFVTFLSLAPRYALSPFFLAEGRNALESLALSQERSRGYRWTMASGLSLFLLPVGIALALLLFFLPSSSASAFFAILVEAFLVMATLVAATAFYVQLGNAILSAPLLSTAEDRGNVRAAVQSSPLPQGSDFSAVTVLTGSRAAEIGRKLDDLAEGLGLEGSPAHEPAVHAGNA